MDNKKTDEHNSEQSPWWNSLPQTEESQVSSPVPDDVPYYDDYSPNKAKIIGIILAIICVVAIIGYGAAYGIQMLNNTSSTEESTKNIEEADSLPSDVYLTVYADGSNEKTSPVSISILKGEEGDETVSASNVKVGEHVKLTSLEGGKYRLHVGTLPSNEDGSTYLPPLFDMNFEVIGDGSDLNLTLNLDSESSIEENKTETKEETQSNNDANASLAQTTDSSTSSGHQHNWQAITQSVHHDAVYRTVNHAAVKERVTICNTCGADVTNNYSGHKASTGHSSSRYETRTVREAYSEQVLVSGAWDETITTGYRCSGCGAVR